MADRKLQYIIEILPKLGKFDDIKKKLEDGITLGPKEIQLLKGQLGETFKGASQEAMALGKEIKKAMSADQIDTSTLVKAVKMIAGAAKELEESGNPIESWGKIGSSIVKPLGDLETRLNNINNDLSKLKNASSVLNELKSTVDGLKTSFANISGGSVVSEIGNIATVSTKIDEATQKAYDSVLELEKQLKSIENRKITLDLSDIQKKINTLKSDLDKAIDIDVDNDTFTRLPLYKEIFALQKQAKKLGSFQIDALIPEHYEDDFKDALKDFDQYATKIKHQYNETIKNVGKDVSPNALVNQLKDVKLSLRVPSKSEIVNKINNVLKTITAEDLESVKINISDIGNIIEDKTKRAYGDKPEVEDANTEVLVEKTSSRLERVAEIIKTKQDKILVNTNNWRKEMIDAMSIAAKNLDFQFGWDKKVNAASGELFDSIQDFFYLPENRLNLIINDEGLKDQLKNIIGDNNITIGGGGTATIDPKAIADVMKSVFYGTPMPTFEAGNIEDSSGISQVNDKLNEVTENSKEYVKELSATTINIQNVIQALRDFAKFSTKEKASKASKDIATWLSGGPRGIDVNRIANGAGDAEIIDMLQNALMAKDETGKAIGRSMTEDLKDLMKTSKMKPNKGAGKSVNNLIRNINELFKSTEVETELNQIIQERKDRIDIYKDVEGAGRSLALLNKIRPSNKKMANFSIKDIPSETDIDAAIKDFEKNKYDTTALNKYMTARKNLGDKTDEQSVSEFKSAVEEFRKTISPLYNKLQGKWGDFKGKVSVEGRKYPIPIKTPNDVLKVPDGAKIVDAIVQKIYESVQTDAYVDENGKYNFRADRKQQRMNSRGDENPKYISTIKPTEDILNESIDYKPFKPLESPDINPDYKVINKKKEEQIKQNEESVKAINKKIEDLNKALKEQEQKVAESQSIQAKIGKLPPYTNTIDDETEAKLDSIVADKQYKIRKARNTISNKQDFAKGFEVEYPKEVVDAINKRDEARQKLNKAINDSSLIETLTVEEAQERIKRFESVFKNSETSDDSMYYYEKFLSNPKEALALLNDKNVQDERIKRLQGNTVNLKQLTMSDVQKLFDQGNSQRYYYKLYKDFVNNPNGVKASLQQTIDNATSDALVQEGYIVKWAKSEEDKLPEAEKILQSTIDKLITQFRSRAKGMYQKVIDLQGRLLNGNLSDESKLVLTSQLQDALNELKSIMSEYDNFSKRYNTNNKTLFGKDKTKAIGKLNSQYLSSSIRDEVNASVEENTSQMSSTRRELTNLENQKQNLQADSQSAQNLIKRSQLQQKYDDLQEKTLNLTAEIKQIEEEDPTNNSLASKRQELENINALLNQIKTNADALGGLLVSAPAEISDAEKQQYARQEAKKYQSKLHTAEVQQRIIQSRIDDIIRQEESIKKQGLGGAGAGAVALNKTKRNLINEFMNSDYVRAAETALRDEAKAAINNDNFESQKLFDEKITDLMTNMGWNPNDKTQVAKFLNTNRGQQLAQEFEKRQKETEEQVWSRYDIYAKELHEKLLEEFKRGLTPNKNGIIKPVFKKQNDNGDWVDEVRSISIKDIILSQLANEKDVLYKKLRGKDGKSGINATIDDLKQQRDRAMAYGGIDYSDIRNDKYLTDIETFTQRIEEKSKELVKSQQDLALLEEGGASKQSLNTQKKKIADIQEEIAWNEQLIENREALIEQKEQERIDSKATPEERRIFATKQLTKLQENLATQDERIAQYKADADAAKGTEKEVSALAKYNDALAYREKLENRIKGKEEYLGKLNTYISNKTAGSSAVDNGEISSPTSGIVGDIVNGVKESIGNISFDTEDLATEDTLSAIRDLLGGGSNSGLTAEEKERMAELEAKGASRLSRNDKKSNYTTTTDGKNISKTDFDNIITKLAGDNQINDIAVKGIWNELSKRSMGNMSLEDIVRGIIDTQFPQAIGQWGKEFAPLKAESLSDVLNLVKEWVVNDDRLIDDAIGKEAEALQARNTAIEQFFNQQGFAKDGKKFYSSRQLSKAQTIGGTLSVEDVAKNIANRIGIAIDEKAGVSSKQIMSDGMEARIARANALSQSGQKVGRSRLLLNSDEAFDKMLSGDTIKGVIQNIIWPKIVEQLTAAGLTDTDQFNNILSSIADNSTWKSKKASSWIHFATSDDKFDGPITKKAYGSFADIGQLSSELINKILDELLAKGFKGQIKIPSDITGFYDTDQIVGHAVDDNSFRILVDTFQKLAKDGILSFVATGVDANTKVLRGKNGASFTQLIEEIYGAAPGQTFTVQEIKSIINSIIKNQSGKFGQELVKPIVDNFISQRASVTVEPEIAPGAVAEEVRENITETPAEAPVEPVVEKTDYQKAVEIVREAIGDFSLRTSNTNKAEKYNSLGQEVKDATNILRTTKEGVTKEGNSLLEKMYKLREAANKVAQKEVNVSQSNLEEDDDDLDQEVLSKILERIEGISNRISSLEDGPEKEELINEYKELSKLIPNNGRTPEEEVELQSLRAKSTNIDSTNTSTGIVGIMQNELAKESTLSQVLNKLGEIAKRNAMSSKPNSAQDLLEQFRRMLESDAWESKERAAYVDLNTGSMSNTITGDDKGISSERLNILRNAYKDVMDLNAQVHTHANEEDPYFSPEDFNQFGIDFANGITKQILLSKNNMTVLDMTDVKNVDGLLGALAKTEQTFEALATTADKFGAKYISKAFNEITPQGLVKMLGIKGIESKLSESETRESARQGIIAEEAKEAASIIQESNGRAVKTTVERVGLELETLIEKTDVKGNKTWSSQINNKTLKAMQATNSQIAGLNLNDVFGDKTDAQIALTEYSDKYTKLLDLAQQFNSASKEERVGLQTQINQLLPLFTEAEKKLVSLIARKDKFMGDKEAIAIFTQDQVGTAGDSLKELAIKQFAGNNDNMAFNGISETPNGTRLLVDVLKDGFISQYAIEVDKATGQVREFMMAESALVNAFQNVNKAMEKNKFVMADIVSPDVTTTEQLEEFLSNANSPMWNTYKTALSDMQKYTVDLLTIMKNGGSVSKEQEDYLMSLSEKVMRLGKELQKTSGEFNNFWAQNPDAVTGIDFYPDDTTRSAMERYAKINANANNSKYDFISFDNDTLRYKLTDIEGNVRNITLVWDELYKKVAMVSDKFESSLDPLVAKVEMLKDKFEDAKNAGYLSSKDGGLEAFYAQIEKINDTVKNSGTFEELESMRKKAIALGDVVNKTISRNKRMPGINEIGAVERQRINMKASFGEDFFDRDDIDAIKEYDNAYKQLIADFETYKKEGTLYNTENQESLRVQATKLKENGKELSKSLLEAQKLQEFVDNSGTYQGKQMGGTKQITAEEANNLEASMKSYLKTLGLTGIENVKFNNTNNTLTASLRTSNKTVADLEMKYNDVTGALYAYQKQERESLTGWPALIKGFKGKITSILQYTASITSIYRVFNTLRQGVQYVKEIDSALTELKKVTDETEETYDKFLNTAAKTAGKVGSTIKEVVSSTADFARLGYSLADAAKMAENAQLLMNVSEFTDISSATDTLISAVQAFSYTADETLHVVDILNKIGNSYAISTSDLASSLTRSSAALVAAGNTMEEAVAMTAAANTIIQD